MWKKSLVLCLLLASLSLYSEAPELPTTSIELMSFEQKTQAFAELFKSILTLMSEQEPDYLKLNQSLDEWLKEINERQNSQSVALNSSLEKLQTENDILWTCLLITLGYGIISTAINIAMEGK